MTYVYEYNVGNDNVKVEYCFSSVTDAIKVVDMWVNGKFHRTNWMSPEGNKMLMQRLEVDMENRMCGTLDDVTVGTEIDLESGVWNGSASSDLDMNTYDIIDIDNLQFTADSGAARDNAKAGMYATDTSTVIINHGATKNFRLTENGT